MRLTTTAAAPLLAALLLAALTATPAPAERLPTAAGEVEVSEMATGLDAPSSLAFLPDGDWLVTERGGRLLLIANGIARPVSGVPEVWAEGQGGLFDVVVAKDYPTSREIFLSFAEKRGPGGGAALAVAKLDEAGATLGAPKVIFRQEPAAPAPAHFGGRVVEVPDGTLFLTLGERQERDRAQYLDNDQGKIVRIRRDGRPAARNPFSGRSDARPEIWSFGHRDPRGMALGPDGTLWIIEHGPRGGDEVNRIAPGRNYGWPIVAFGEEDDGGAIGQGTEAPGMEPPRHVWAPSIAPSGLMVYSGKLWPEWGGQLFTGALDADYISRLSPDGHDELERLLGDVFSRIGDIREAPDGSIWFIAEEDGAVFRMAPAPAS